MTATEERSPQRRAAAVIRLLADPEHSPLFAAIGVGDVLRTAATDTVRRVRADMRRRREDAADNLTLAFGRLPRNADELVQQLTPAELRKRAEHCGRFGVELYEFFTARGEIAVSKVQDDAETAHRQGKHDLGALGARFAAAAFDDLHTLAVRLTDRDSGRS